MIYFVSTPIGNLEDITIRAIKTLENSDIIYCEDTRTSKKLLDAYDIKVKLSSYHKFNEKERVDEIVGKALDGLTISIISDAGMPAISDPGNILINSLIENNIDYTVLPGPSAFTTALVLSGFDNSEFKFSGFFPSKDKDRKNLIEKIKKDSCTTIFYESPHRILKTLEYLSENISDHNIAVVREISKIHEDIKIFKAKDYKDMDIVDKGEIVLLIDKYDKIEIVDDEIIKDKMLNLLSEGLTKKSAIKILHKELNINKNKLYDISLEL